MEVTVFDTGRLRAGGRASTRQIGDTDKDGKLHRPILSRYRYDHAAQIVRIDPVAFPEFSRRVTEEWVPKGLLKPFSPGALYRLESATIRHDLHPTRTFRSEKNEPPELSYYYFAPRGMGYWVEHGILEDGTGKNRVTVQHDTWISPSNGARYNATSQQWTLRADSRVVGRFDRILIAHNGKCADRLMSKTPARRVHRLLRVRFDSHVPSAEQQKMTLSSLYSWTFCVPIATTTSTTTKSSSPLTHLLGESFVCGFIENCPEIRFLTCQTRKLTQDKDDDEGIRHDHEVWTVLSSSEFAQKHKAPQEFLGPEVITNVTTMLGHSLERYLTLPPGSILQRIVDQHLQLWGAGVPLNTYRRAEVGEGKQEGFVYDSQFGVGVCGDWLLDPSVAGAWTSGRSLADHLLLLLSSSEKERLSCGLEEGGRFVLSDAAMRSGIGSLGSESSIPAIAASGREAPC
jgi:predicted NAD/FAD-dependent oxidoreductase